MYVSIYVLKVTTLKLNINIYIFLFTTFKKKKKQYICKLFHTHLEIKNF